MKYLMPAEWEPHEGTWLAWPHNREHWPGKFEPTPLTYVEIIRAVAESEKVFVTVNGPDMEAEARSYLQKGDVSSELLKNIFFYHIPTDASWARDHGPIFVRDENGKLLITDWIFNAWGDKYRPYDQDDVVPQKIGAILGFDVVQPGMVLEGGSIEVNGQGLLLTTEQCLLNQNRNPSMNREEIEAHLGRYLGIKKVLWLKEGIVGDDTDGHIDDIARFVNPTTVVCAVESDPQDENYPILQECLEDLKKMTDQDGKPLNVVAVPMPEPVVHAGERLPASYVNFLITNKSVLVPTFRSSRDQEALAVLARCFPDRKIVGIDCWDLVWGLGTIHCSTQQQPVRSFD
ncbi:MAG: agmatine deiminase family protein [Candidatus Gracilibacteria bacterium]